MPVKPGAKLIEIAPDILEQLKKEQETLRSSVDDAPIYTLDLTRFVNAMLRSLYE